MIPVAKDVFEYKVSIPSGRYLQVYANRKDETSTPVGSLSAVIDSTWGGGFINSVDVDREFRGQGICRPMVRTAMQYFQEQKRNGDEKEETKGEEPIVSLKNTSYPTQAGCRCYLGAGSDLGLYPYSVRRQRNFNTKEDEQCLVPLAETNVNDRCNETEYARGVVSFYAKPLAKNRLCDPTFDLLEQAEHSVALVQSWLRDTPEQYDAEELVHLLDRAKSEVAKPLSHVNLDSLNEILTHIFWILSTYSFEDPDKEARVKDEGKQWLKRCGDQCKEFKEQPEKRHIVRMPVRVVPIEPTFTPIFPLRYRK